MLYRYLFLKKISILQTVILSGLLSSLVYFAVRLNFENKIMANEVPVVSHKPSKVLRNMNEFKFAKPIYAVESGQNSSNLDPIRKQVSALIDEDCKLGDLFQASLYLRDMESGEWTSINEDATYHPGSLIKVPMLIYYLKQSEKDPSILDKTLSVDSKLSGLPAQTFTKYTIEDNKPYTVRELLKYMASYSDNKATYLLNKNADIPTFQKIFTDLGLQVPDVHDTNYSITVRDYSLFLRVLYNATYLNPKNSDFALSLLTQCSFDQGLAKLLPNGLEIAHKFGESKNDNKRELHESGIIYCNKRPYLVTVMTKGYNPVNQAEVISKVSELIYHYFCS